jgi:hypothetical protein
MEINRTLQKSERSCPIEDIPWLMTIRKVKPKEKTKNVRVTQVYGSMEGKHILELTGKIRREKEEKEEVRKSAAMKRQTSNEAFFRCKLECVCLRSSGKCDAASLKQCSVCHNILHSVSHNAARTSANPLMTQSQS